MGASKASFHRSKVLARVLCLPTAAALLWFLYWIGYDLVVWNKSLLQVRVVNYIAAILSSAIFIACYRLGSTKNRVGQSIQSRQDPAKALKWLQVEREDEFRIGLRYRLETVNDELTELRHRCHEIQASLKSTK